MPIDDASSLAQAAADQVRRLIEEAEGRAREIVGRAETEAAAIRDRAEVEARERIDAARRALDELGGKLGRPTVAEIVPPGPPTPDPVPPVPTPDPGPAPTPDPAPPTPAPDPEPPRPEPVPAPEPQLAASEVAAPPQPTNDDGQAARLVALKLALDGTARDVAKKELSAQYSVADIDGLLDDVYAKAGL